MLCRIRGRVVALDGHRVVLEVGDLACEVLVPASAREALQRLVGQSTTLHTLMYLEGMPTGTTLVPRLIGFLSEVERDFFTAFTKVKGISMRRALRAMELPAHQIAAAIEAGDARLLTALPEIGRKTAAQIINDLRGTLERFVVDRPAATPPVELSEAQRVAVEILVSWGDKPADARQWVMAAVAEQPDLERPDDIVRAAYRLKQSV